MAIISEPFWTVATRKQAMLRMKLSPWATAVLERLRCCALFVWRMLLLVCLFGCVCATVTAQVVRVMGSSHVHRMAVVDTADGNRVRVTHCCHDGPKMLTEPMMQHENPHCRRVASSIAV